MAHSFDAQNSLLVSSDPDAALRRRIFVTGAAGRISSYFTEHSHHKYDLRLTDISFGEYRETLGGYGKLIEGEMHDLDFLERACEGIVAVVHMPGNPDASAVWNDLLETNIIGTYNACVAARAAGCRRIIHASSIHAVSGYPPDVQVKTTEPSNPGDLCGVTKCFGESLDGYLSSREEISFIALRIGAFRPLSAARDVTKFATLNSFYRTAT